MRSSATTTARAGWGALGAGAAAVVLASGCAASSGQDIPSGRADPATLTAPAGLNDVAVYLTGVRTWVACLHGNGVEVTDPDPTGQVTFSGDPAQLKADRTFQQAQETCRSLHPPVPQGLLIARRPKLSPQQVETMRRYAACMQDNGAPDFPEPGPDGYPDRAIAWSQGSAGARHAGDVCASIIGDPTSQPTSQG